MFLGCCIAENRISVVGLGIQGESSLGKHIDLILCILPFICIYVDFICYHNNIRILVIAQHLQLSGDDYENFMGKLSNITIKKQGVGYYFKLEDYAIIFASYFISLLIIVYSFIMYKISDIFKTYEGYKMSVFIITGIIGLIFTFLAKLMCNKKSNLLFESTKKMKLNIQAIHNKDVSALIKESYTFDEILYLQSLLNKNDTFLFRSLHNGLFSAADLSKRNKFTNYDKVWIRDNIYVAFAHQENGESEIAMKTVLTLGDFFFKYKNKFKGIDDKTYDYKNVMNRPHVRFDGNKLEELPEKWAHAENDALGYYLWLLVNLIKKKVVHPRQEEFELIPLFVKYFDTISYWQDEDSGHWEETRKIESSSIGVVLCALYELKMLMAADSEKNIKVDTLLLNKLIENGIKKIKEILPNECIQQENNKFREADAAQLFLIYPLNLFENVLQDKDLEDKVLNNVLINLKGKYGIKRYLGDSFWTADTKNKQNQDEITADYSEKITERNKNHIIGEEAQWCIFDSIVSIIYGKKYQHINNKNLLMNQFHYLNRALAQLTGDNCKYGSFRCPELYYINKGEYTNNDTVPLLWAQANLWLAFKEIKQSVLTYAARSSSPPYQQTLTGRGSHTI